MNSRLKLIIAALFFSIVVMESALADGSFRCGTHVISVGQGKDPGMYEVLKKCGEPDQRYGKTFIYKSGSISRTLTFGGSGKLNTIE
jgi:hypothetical protein